MSPGPGHASPATSKKKKRKDGRCEGKNSDNPSSDSGEGAKRFQRGEVRNGIAGKSIPNGR